MWSKFIIITVVVFLFGSCALQRKVSRINDETSREYINIKTNCETLELYKTLYISKINTKLVIEEDHYNARLAIYYIPDSMFYISAVNTGFEIVRMAIYEDSTVYINRLEKMVYILKDSKVGFSSPIAFEDVEYLFNKSLVCNEMHVADSTAMIDRSKRDVLKSIEYSTKDFKLRKFEFFQKKTGEYIVGERTEKNNILIYTNYLGSHFIIEGSDGEIEFNRNINVELNINEKKYDIVYL